VHTQALHHLSDGDYSESAELAAKEASDEFHGVVTGVGPGSGEKVSQDEIQLISDGILSWISVHQMKGSPEKQAFTFKLQRQVWTK
jgi:hypothetical protein